MSNYYLVYNGEFAYNKSTSDGYPFGAVKRLDWYEKGVLSTLYIVFALKHLEKDDSDFMTVFYDTDRWHRGVAERAAEGARNHGLLNISADDFFDIDTLVAGKDAILARRKEIEMLRENRQSSNKDEGLWDVFEIALEMIDRGFHFSPLNLEKSDASNFILDPDDPSGLLPPFSSVDSLGESVAKTVIEARERGPFLSKEDVIKRTKLNNSHIKQLTKMGVFNGMQEENQLSLF